jgi:hypothetical protein
VQRLAHPHQNDIEVILQAAGGNVLTTGDQHLCNDFSRRQVASEPQLTGEAELAGEGAADLRRHAERVAPVLRDENRFGQFTVCQAEQVPSRSVRGIEGAVEFGESEVQAGSEFCSERLRKAGDTVEVSDSVPVDGLEQLRRTKLRLEL